MLVDGVEGLSFEDRFEIAELQNRYAFALDNRNWDLLRLVFSEDAEVEFLEGPHGIEGSTRLSSSSNVLRIIQQPRCTTATATWYGPRATTQLKDRSTIRPTILRRTLHCRHPRNPITLFTGPTKIGTSESAASGGSLFDGRRH